MNSHNIRIIIGAILTILLMGGFSMLTAKSVYDFGVKSIDGKDVKLTEYRGKVLLIVNTASKCGFTKQYEDLQKLYDQYGKDGLVVLGFPANNFMNQEPGDNHEIQNFCRLNYGVSFPMMAKVQVNGAEAHPLWQWLKKQAPGLLGSEGVKWNFTKFLVGRDGTVLKRYAPTDTPESIRKDIEKALKS